MKAITEQLCGVNISSSAVSQAALQLDTELEKWREFSVSTDGEYNRTDVEGLLELLR